MLRVRVVDKHLGDAVRARVLEGGRALKTCCPLADRRVRRWVRNVVVVDQRHIPMLVRRHTLFLDHRLVQESPPQVIALAMVYGATAMRLHRHIRYAPRDRHAQFWRRVANEVIDVARRLDHADDPGGYIPGVSSGFWEQWARSWLGRAALTRRSRLPSRLILRELRRIGVPRWLRRPIVLVAAWRSAPYVER